MRVAQICSKECLRFLHEKSDKEKDAKTIDGPNTICPSINNSYQFSIAWHDTTEVQTSMLCVPPGNQMQMDLGRG